MLAVGWDGREGMATSMNITLQRKLKPSPTCVIVFYRRFTITHTPSVQSAWTRSHIWNNVVWGSRKGKGPRGMDLGMLYPSKGSASTGEYAVPHTLAGALSIQERHESQPFNHKAYSPVGKRSCKGINQIWDGTGERWDSSRECQHSSSGFKSSLSLNQHHAQMWCRAYPLPPGGTWQSPGHCDRQVLVSLQMPPSPFTNLRKRGLQTAWVPPHPDICLHINHLRNEKGFTSTDDSSPWQKSCR